MKCTRVRCLFASVVVLMLADVAAVNASSPPTYARGTNFDVAKRAALRRLARLRNRVSRFNHRLIRGIQSDQTAARLVGWHVNTQN